MASSVSEVLNELIWPSLEAIGISSPSYSFIREASFEIDNFMTRAQNSKTTRSSHSAQYCRYQTYSEALNDSFFPRTIPHWNSLSPSVANTQTI